MLTFPLNLIWSTLIWKTPPIAPGGNFQGYNINLKTQISLRKHLFQTDMLCCNMDWLLQKLKCNSKFELLRKMCTRAPSAHEVAHRSYLWQQHYKGEPKGNKLLKTDLIKAVEQNKLLFLNFLRWCVKYTVVDLRHTKPVFFV